MKKIAKAVLSVIIEAIPYVVFYAISILLLVLVLLFFHWIGISMWVIQLGIIIVLLLTIVVLKVIDKLE